MTTSKKIPNPDSSQNPEPPRQQNRGGSLFVGDSKQVHTITSHFGDRLKREREKAGLTQEQLAGLVPLNRAYLSEIETGKRQVSLNLAFRLARALSLTLDQMTGMD
jgi:DNA-binding XRE family transcriptional regulator